MARGTQAAPSTLTVEDWKLLKRDLDKETAREIGDLLITHDPSTFDGFSRICARFGLLIAQMRIHPEVARAATRYFEMSFTSLLVGQDKHIPPAGGEGTSILQLISVARDTAKQLEQKPQPLRIIESDDEDDS